MKQVKTAPLSEQRPPQRRRPVEPPKKPTRKIRDLNAFEIDRPFQRYVTVAFTIDVRREHVDVVTMSRQRAAERMDRLYGATVAYGGQVGRNDVKQAQGLTGDLQLMPFQ